MSLKSNEQFERVAHLLESCEWVFAKTMPENPHHYTLRKRWNDSDFTEVVQYIRDKGYKFIYKGRPYMQLDINGFFYWTMGAPMNSTILINRKALVYNAAYDAIAPQYDNLFQDTDSMQENEAVIAMLGNLDNKSVLDVGCGTGILLDYATPKDYTGIDISIEMLNQLVKKHPRYQHSVVNTSLASFANGKRYDRIVALFGAASYLTQAELERIPALLAPDGQTFLMFYATDYTPVTYQKTGLTAQPVSYANVLSNAAQPYHHFEIVQGRL